MNLFLRINTKMTKRKSKKKATQRQKLPLNLYWIALIFLVLIAALSINFKLQQKSVKQEMLAMPAPPAASAPALVFKTETAVKIVVTKVLSFTPEGRTVLTAYKGATMLYSLSTNPTQTVFSAAVGKLDEMAPGSSAAIQTLMGANPMTILKGMALDKVQQEIIGKIYESLPPDQKVLFLNAQEYGSYIKQTFQITDENELKKYADMTNFNQTSGILTIKTKDGKDFLQIPKGWEMKSGENGILSITSTDEENQEFKFADKASAYLKKGGTIKIKDDQIIEADFITSKESRLKLGDNKELSVGANTKVSYKKGEISVGEDGKFSKIMYGDDLLTSNNTMRIFGDTYKGKDFQLNNLHVRGTIIQLGKNAYRKTGDSWVETEGMIIKPDKNFNSEVDIYFDGKEHSGNYVSLSKEKRNLIISSDEKKRIDIYFTKENNILRIGENGQFNIDSLSNNKIIIKNRDDEGLIPQMTMISKEKSEGCFIDNGAKTIELDEGKVKIRGGNRADMESTPLSLILQDGNGNNLIGTEKEPKKYIMSNFNEIGAVPLKETEGIIEDYDYSPGKISERMSYAYHKYTVREFNEKFPNIKIEGNAVNSLTVKKMMDNLDHMPPAIRDSMKEITISDNLEFRNVYCPQFAGACASPGKIHLTTSQMEESTFYHEAAHTLTFNLEQNKDKMVQSAATYFKQEALTKINQEVGGRYNPDDLKVLDNGELYIGWRYGNDKEKDVNTKLDSILKEYNNEIKTAVEGKSFEEKWKAVAGDVYGRNIEQDPKTFAVIWKDSKSQEGSAHGCVKAYGCYTFYEDVATFVENIYRNPEAYLKLMESPEKDIYFKKLKLLEQNKFITPEMLANALSKRKTT